MRHAGLSLLLLATILPAQSTQVKKFFEQRAALQTQAKSAFDREMAREKAGDCHDANTTYDIVMCLEKANESTGANYQAYAGALRAMLAQKNPYDNGEGPVLRTNRQTADPGGERKQV